MAGALTAAIASIFSGSAVTADPYYEYTTLLLPGNGTNGAQNNTFLDGSTNNFTITRNGNTTQGTFSPFSQTGWGNYFDGTGDNLVLPSSSNLAFGTGDFCVEAWVYWTATGVLDAIYSNLVNSAGGDTQFNFELTATNKVRVTAWSTVFLTGATSVVSNTWNHIAVCRSGTTLSIFLNGTRDATTTTSNNWSSTNAFYIGDYPVGGSAFSGYISNLRVVKGSTPYDATSSSLTVPTAPLTAITNTQLLTCQSNRFRDASTNNFTITRNGDTSVVAFSPFNPTASWSAATYGGSGYFDGNTDYLSAASNAAFTLGSSTDFCVEAWIYSTGTPGTDAVIAGTWQNGSSAFANRWFLSLRTSGTIIYWWDSTGSPGITYTGITTNQWVHIAVARSSSTITLYVNGVSRGTQTTNQAYTTQDSLKIGGGITGTSDFPGYISNFRLVVGSPVYTANFTPPTAPLTAITNTSLLLNYTNAGIYDATSKNDLETVGNAQISTIQSKWGGSSMSFDGTGDWLLIPDQPIQRIGTGNFTVEGWVYRNSSGTYGLIGKGTGTTGWLVSLNSSNQVVFTYGSSTITSTGTVSATTWTHIAVVREGTSTNQTKIYINGTNDGTGTVSTDFNQTNSMYVGADRTGGSAANAYMQDVRVTNYARYTSNFTAPTAAFPTL
jgi:hypothetical protein